MSFLTESRFSGHDYYRDGDELIQDDEAIAEIWDDGTVSFYQSCKLSEDQKIAMLKAVTKKSPDLNDLYYKGMSFADGKMVNEED